MWFGDLGFMAWGLGLRVLGFWVEGFGARPLDLGLFVQGFELGDICRWILGNRYCEIS